MKKFLLGLFLGVFLVLGGWLVLNKKKVEVKTEIVDEESVVTRVVEEATPSVVTVSIIKTQETIDINTFIGTTQTTEQDIGTGFIITTDGLIVTNKHVVADLTAKYKAIIGKDEVVEVKNIYRDPLNDLAILSVGKTGLNAVMLGDSDKLKVGQSVIAIGTALGEFRSTVTTGVISGLGRGIVAGSPISGTEKLDNVIQTDAAINPGNSGGPLFNSGGEVIGVSVAVSQNGQNIGFAIPINIVKESIDNFRKTGEFERPYLGISYKMISKEIALKNNLVTGAYVQTISENSPASKAKIQIGDIITEIDGQILKDDQVGDLIRILNARKIGNTVQIKIWRSGKEILISVVLEKRAS